MTWKCKVHSATMDDGEPCDHCMLEDAVAQELEDDERAGESDYPRRPEEGGPKRDWRD